MKISPNEGAFACPSFEGENYQHAGNEGLTKRELFAAMAMQGRLSWIKGATTRDDAAIARQSVAYADALIAALNEETP